jgi:hypothetical protein
MVNFLPWLLYSQERTPIPIGRRLDGSQGWSGSLGEEKHLFPVPVFEPWIAQPIMYTLH